MLGVCVTRMTDTMTEFKGNVSMVFAVENTIRLITYAVLGLFTMSAIRTAHDSDRNCTDRYVYGYAVQ